MAHILNIETATAVCSVALSIDGEISAVQESFTRNSHSELITIFCEKVIEDAGIRFSHLDAVSISKGPGSYTGLRIGVSTAKGFCYGLDIPLISYDTLSAMAIGMKSKLDYNNGSFPTLFCPMIDARRMEVYTALFNETLDAIENTSAQIIDKDSFSKYLSTHKIVFAGDGAAKCKEILNHQPNAIFVDDFHPSATYLSKISEQKFQAMEFEDTAYFEPYYLKDFVAGKPKVKGLR